MDKKQYYEYRAAEYAEKYGIVEYKVKGNKMIYNKSYPAYLSQPRYTVQHTVLLDDFTSITKILKRYDPKGVHNTY